MRTGGRHTIERLACGRRREVRPLRSAVPVGLLVLGTVFSSGAVGCQTSPLDGVRGARYYASGSEALRAGDTESALVDLRRAAELVPHASEIQNHLGLAYWAEGDLARARSAFDRALALDCDNVAAERNRRALVEAVGDPAVPTVVADEARAVRGGGETDGG